MKVKSIERLLDAVMEEEGNILDWVDVEAVATHKGTTVASGRVFFEDGRQEEFSLSVDILIG